MTLVIAIPTNNTGNFTEVPGRSQNAAYVKYVKMCGFTPILVPMEADPNVIVNIADGLLLAGGIDVDPIYYGYSNTASLSTDPAKDVHERALLYAFVNSGKRVFGICRGMQLIFREVLYELERLAHVSSNYFDYIENMAGHGQTSSLHIDRRHPSHYVSANMGGLLTLGKNTTPEKLPVNSMHHQVCVFKHGALAVDVMNTKEGKVKIQNIKEPVITKVNLPIGLFQALAWSLRGVEFPKSDKDYGAYWSILEAFKIENKKGCNILAVQWHPEELRTIDLLKNFFTANNAADTKVANAVG